MSTVDIDIGDLGELQEIADGGQGQVYRLPARPGQLLKRYHRHVCDDLNVAELRRLIACPGRMTPSDRHVIGEATAWPMALVRDGSRYVGFLMREAPERFSATIGKYGRLLELQFLLHPVKPMWRALALPSAEQRRELAAGYVRFFQLLHRYDIIVGDVSMRNFLWTLRGGPGIFALDCDGYRLNGHHPAVPQGQTPDWEDRTMPAGRATLESDRYKLALLVIRVLLADPYLTPQAVVGQPALRQRLGEPLSRLAERATADTGRPGSAQWLRALDDRPTVTLPKPARPIRQQPAALPPEERPKLAVSRPVPPDPGPPPLAASKRPTIRLTRPDARRSDDE